MKTLGIIGPISNVVGALLEDTYKVRKSLPDKLVLTLVDEKGKHRGVQFDLHHARHDLNEKFDIDTVKINIEQMTVTGETVASINNTIATGRCSEALANRYL